MSLESGTTWRIQQLCRHLLDMHMTSLGSDHSQTISAWVRLSRPLHGRGKYDEAEEISREVYNRGPEGWGDGNRDPFLRSFADTLAQ